MDVIVTEKAEEQTSFQEPGPPCGGSSASFITRPLEADVISIRVTMTRQNVLCSGETINNYNNYWEWKCQAGESHRHHVAISGGGV